MDDSTWAGRGRVPLAWVVAAIAIAVVGTVFLTSAASDVEAGSTPRVKIIGKRSVKLDKGETASLVKTNRLQIRARCESNGPEEAVRIQVRAPGPEAWLVDGSSADPIASSWELIASIANDSPESTQADFEVVYRDRVFHRVHVTGLINTFGRDCMAVATVTNA